MNADLNKMIAQREREANHFARALLMPRFLIEKWVKKFGIPHPNDVIHISRMANDFQVSRAVVKIRLKELGYWDRLSQPVLRLIETRESIKNENHLS